jgi:hypothetical protein
MFSGAHVRLTRPAIPQMLVSIGSKRREHVIAFHDHAMHDLVQSCRISRVRERSPRIALIRGDRGSKPFIRDVDSRGASDSASRAVPRFAAYV